jgi:hypothetical protein
MAPGRRRRFRQQRAGAAQNMANQPLSAAKVLRAGFHAKSIARHECATDV